MKAFPSKKPIIKNLGKFGPIEFKPIIEDGMDLRDYFAAKAMQAMLSWEDCGTFNVSKEAYQMADAMMEAREK